MYMITLALTHEEKPARSRGEVIALLKHYATLSLQVSVTNNDEEVCGGTQAPDKEGYPWTWWLGRRQEAEGYPGGLIMITTSRHSQQV